VLLLRTLLSVVRVGAWEHRGERPRHAKRVGRVHAEEHAPVLRHSAKIRQSKSVFHDSERHETGTER
jgi:hypothetical protein